MNQGNSLKSKEWNESYENKDNFLFYPNEHLIRFVSKYYRKQVGISEFIEQRCATDREHGKCVVGIAELVERGDALKCLDLGCGIGRHIKFLHEFGFEAYGIDLSETAITFAKKWFASLGLWELNEHLHIGSVSELPFEDCYFDMIVSHGVLDSMFFNIAQKSIAEAARVLKPSALFYLDLISEKTSGNLNGAIDETVSTKLERGTIQSYYDMPKIHTLVDKWFNILDIAIETVNFHTDGNVYCRFHLALEKRSND